MLAVVEERSDLGGQSGPMIVQHGDHGVHVCELLERIEMPGREAYELSDRCIRLSCIRQCDGQQGVLDDHTGPWCASERHRDSARWLIVESQHPRSYKDGRFVLIVLEPIVNEQRGKPAVSQPDCGNATVGQRKWVIVED
ncbi:MAG TPA: hypothetical protein VHS55_03940 [Solirubrobacteraceae bacterium]|nr:hypothetical protein [Solirubrobacteraceae bacterium]